MENRITKADNLFDQYLKLVEISEPPLLYHRWSLISAIATSLGRNVWLDFGTEIIYPNMYVVLIGPPGARKSSAIKVASTILEDTGFESFAGDKSSKEKFLLDWEHGFDLIYRGIEPGGDKDLQEAGFGSLLETVTLEADKTSVREVFIKAGELQDFLGAGSSDFIVMLTNLWDNLPHYSSRFKNSKNVRIPNPTVNLLGGATTTTFASIFSTNIIGQGMLSRLILVHGKGPRGKITIPPPLNPIDKTKIVKQLHNIRYNLRGAITFGEEVYSMIDSIYQSWEELPDARLASYGSRRFSHFLKLCIICAATEMRTELIPKDILLANSILTYTETYMSKALGEFGKSKSSEVSQIVLDTISNVGEVGGIALNELMTIVGQDVESVEDLVKVVIKLESTGKIKRIKRENGPPVYLPTKRVATKKLKYVDFNLLYEHNFGENS